MVIYNIDRDTWSTGIFIFIHEDIFKSFLKAIDHPFMGKNRDIALPEKEWPYIIKPGGMIIMFMSIKDRIKMRNVMSKHLCPEIGATINQDIILLPFHQHRNS